MEGIVALAVSSYSYPLLAYLLVRGGTMHDRAMQETQRRDQELRQYVQEAGGSQSSADKLAELADLRDHRVISPTEFEHEKTKILA